MWTHGMRYFCTLETNWWFIKQGLLPIQFWLAIPNTSSLPLFFTYPPCRMGWNRGFWGWREPKKNQQRWWCRQRKRGVECAQLFRHSEVKVTKFWSLRIVSHRTPHRLTTNTGGSVLLLLVLLWSDRTRIILEITFPGMKPGGRPALLLALTTSPTATAWHFSCWVLLFRCGPVSTYEPRHWIGNIFTHADWKTIGRPGHCQKNGVNRGE